MARDLITVVHIIRRRTGHGIIERGRQTIDVCCWQDFSKLVFRLIGIMKIVELFQRRQTGGKHH